MEKHTNGRSRSKRSKLQRTEVVTMRLDPRLRYLAELAARAQRRTVSSYLEGALEKALGETQHRKDSSTFIQFADILWHPFESDRFVKLALRFPEWLTYEEGRIWIYIQECDALWACEAKQRRDLGPQQAEDAFNFGLLRTHWETFQQVAAGDADPSQLPKPDGETARTPPSRNETGTPCPAGRE